MLCAVGLFSGVYHQQIRKNVLTTEELKEGFNSEDNTSLKFSFWILVGACFLPLLNITLTFLNSARAKSYFNKTTTIPTSNVDGMMLYWNLSRAGFSRSYSSVRGYWRCITLSLTFERKLLRVFKTFNKILYFFSLRKTNYTGYRLYIAWATFVRMAIRTSFIAA